jgi:Spy/CpxP family protein refolding chaperone
MATVYEALTPLLTPDQRAKLSDKLKQRGNADPKENP